MLRIENVNFFRVLSPRDPHSHKEGLDTEGTSAEQGQAGNAEAGRQEGRLEKIPSPHSKRVRHTVSLAAFKSVAITPFSFPFNNALRVREALKLQTLPYAAAGEMQLFPSILKKTPRTCSGVALYIPSGELENCPMPPSQVENKIWPAPLPLASKVGGEGVTFWLDEENVCSMLWRDGIPAFYRWRSRAAATLETERAWYESYCKSKGEEVGEVFVLDAAIPSELADLPNIAKESMTLYPWIGGVNMSRSALDSAVVLERTVHVLSKVAIWFLVMGLFVLTGNGLRYSEARRNINELRGRSVELYRSVFEPARTGPVTDPLSLARFSVQQLRGGSSDTRSISEMFLDLGDIFEQNPDMNITLDVVRYNTDGADFTGIAPNVEAVQEFRRALAERAGSTRIGNLNTVPGGAGYRFDLSVRW